MRAMNFATALQSRDHRHSQYNSQMMRPSISLPAIELVAFKSSAALRYRCSFWIITVLHVQRWMARLSFSVKYAAAGIVEGNEHPANILADPALASVQ
jgi:hypothetical protein